jgi:hypothetical protein
MTVEELALICQAHELIESGSRHCKLINKAYKLVPGSLKSATRNKKIEAINNFFDQVRAETLARLIVRQKLSEKAGENIIVTGITFTEDSEAVRFE